MPRRRSTKSASLAAWQTGSSVFEAGKQTPDHVASLTWGERFDVLDAWLLVLDGLYAHLPLKRAMYGFDPLKAIEHLRQQATDLTDLQFHRDLTTLINRLRDAHTQYSGPKWLEDAVASLPFLVEMYGPPELPCYVVTKVNRRRV